MKGIKVSYIEEIAYRMGYINRNQLKKLGNQMSNNSYGKYLLEISDNDLSV